MVIFISFPVAVVAAAAAVVVVVEIPIHHYEIP